MDWIVRMVSSIDLLVWQRLTLYSCQTVTVEGVVWTAVGGRENVREWHGARSRRYCWKEGRQGEKDGGEWGAKEFGFPEAILPVGFSVS